MTGRTSRRDFLALTSAALVGSVHLAGAHGPPGEKLYAYVGSRTRGPGFGLGGGGGIGVFTVNMNDGSLTQVDRTGEDFDDLNSDGMCISADGRFLYAVNETLTLDGKDGAVFEVDEDTGRLSLVEIVPRGGRNPREMNFDPSGRFLFVANVQSDQVVTFAVDADTGRLTPTGADAEAPRPSCVHLVTL